jgi:ADP-ribosylglycohydrolase/protein-tyrosine phosphatase
LTKARTSLTHPLKIAAVGAGSAGGQIGITFAPGKCDPYARSGPWQRDLRLDVAAIRTWGAEALVTLVEPHEFEVLSIQALPAEIKAAGLEWYHLPIRDVSIPDGSFERRWLYAGPRIRRRIAGGGRVVVHCRGGLGRAGLVAARLLVEMGITPRDAINRVRAAREGAIETRAQEAYVGQVMAAPESLEWQDRFIACLLGGAIGDAFGYAVEFDRLAAIKRRFGDAGLQEPVLTGAKLVASDDTQMTLFSVAAAASASFRSDPVQALRSAYLDWLDTQRGGHPAGTARWLAREPAMRARRAPGITCLSALEAGGGGTPEAPINDSKGCGGVMRVAPLAFLPDLNLARAVDLGARAAALTHGHPSGYLAAGALTGFVWLASQGRSLGDSASEVLDVLRPRAGSGEAVSAIERALLLAKRQGAHPDAVARKELGEGWVGEEALAIALYSALVGKDFQDAIRIATNHDGDSDSTASIAGQLLGAAQGCIALPLAWLEPLDLLDPLLRAADEFIATHAREVR